MCQATDRITLSVPRASWELLRATLELDSQSHAFDSHLRTEISDALEAVEEVPAVPHGCAGGACACHAKSARANAND
jgi:hypothetical protein